MTRKKSSLSQALRNIQQQQQQQQPSKKKANLPPPLSRKSNNNRPKNQQSSKRSASQKQDPYHPLAGHHHHNQSTPKSVSSSISQKKHEINSSVKPQTCLNIPNEPKYSGQSQVHIINQSAEESNNDMNHGNHLSNRSQVQETTRREDCIQPHIKTDRETGLSSSSSDSEKELPTITKPAHGAKNPSKPQLAILNRGDRVLLIGEGNFSFAVSLVIEHLHPGNLITATTIDAEERVQEKYQDSQEMIKRLEENHVRILYRLDGCRLNEDKRIKKILKTEGKFDKVIFNFPHLGGSESHQDRIVRNHQILILRFLRSVSTLLFHPSDLDQSIPRPDDFQHSNHSKRTSIHLKSPSNPSKKPKSNHHRQLQKKRPIDTFDSDSDSSENSSLDFNDFNLESGFDQSNQNLHRSSKLRKPGTVLITTGTDSPYSLWNVPMLAKNGRVLAHTILYPSYPNLRSKGEEQPNYKLIRSFDFNKLISSNLRTSKVEAKNDDEPNSSIYQHRQTNGFKQQQRSNFIDQNFDRKSFIKDSLPSNPRTWEFQLCCLP